MKMYKLNHDPTLLNESFRDNGYLIFEPSKEISCIVSEGLQEINSVGYRFSPDFCLQNSKLIADLNRKGFYKAIRRCLSLYRLATSEAVVGIAKMLGVASPAMGPSSIRLDVFEEQGHQFHWHQDAASLLGSLNMFTYWIPYSDVSADLGTIELIPGSHRRGLLAEIDARDPDVAAKEASKNLILSRGVSAAHGGSFIIEVPRASCVVLHPLLIHRSFYPDRSHPCRVTGLVRLDDMGDVRHLKLGGKSASDNFNIVNSPEYLSYYQPTYSVTHS